jgi:pimeloyl-ACP methyl ester carboxylesterase
VQVAPCLHEFRPEGKAARGSVLVIHGWRSRTEYMHLLIEGFLEAGYRVLSLDLPGHGGSLGRRLNMALAVEAVRRAADWFGPFTAMVGHSFGGAVAVNAAVGSVDGLAPVAVDRLVTIASPSSMPKLFADFGRMLKLGPRSQSVVEAQVERLTGHGIVEFDSARQLLRVPLPTLVIHDADDREVSVEEARSTARAGDHVRLNVTRGLGHRRIITDPNVVRETVEFVTASMEPAMLHLNASALARFGLRRQLRLLPRAKAAEDVFDVFQAHVLRRLGGQGRAPAAGAEEDKSFVLGEIGLVIRAFRVDPELQHAARAFLRAGNGALTLDLARVAQIDEQHVFLFQQIGGVLRRDGFHFAIGFVEIVAKSLFHLSSSCRGSATITQQCAAKTTKA